MEQYQRLFNRNFIIIGVATFLMFFAFYLLMPVIAMYVINEFGASASVAGVVVAAYIITSLLARPFSGYLVDKYDRRRFYLLTFSLFTLLFIGYIISSSILMIFITRVLLGAAFSLVTTASSTLAIDVMPSKRRAEGMGYFGAMGVLAMALGPMAGLYLMEMFSYEGLFVIAMMSCVLGVMIAMFIKTEHRPSAVQESLSLDRFYLKSGTSIAVIVALIYFMFGTLMVYVSLYVEESGVDINAGDFFLFIAIGVIISRIISGKLLNRGLHSVVLQAGIATIIVASTIFIFFLNPITFPISSLLLGVGFGCAAPAVQSMVIELVPPRRRGTANSTYFIALDLGSGIGMLLGGVIAENFGYRAIYIVGLGLAILALILYKLYSQRDYQKRYEIAMQSEEI